MLHSQHNAWVHAAVSLAVVIAGLGFGVSAVEWALIALAIRAVGVTEALNTAFEILCDVVSPESHPLVEKSKDVAAGAVLISVIGAIFVGLFVFGPRLHALVGFQ